MRKSGRIDHSGSDGGDDDDDADTVTGVVRELKAVAASPVGSGGAGATAVEKNADVICTLEPKVSMVRVYLFLLMMVVIGGDRW